MYIVKLSFAYTLSTLYIVKLVKCLFLFSLTDFILVKKRFSKAKDITNYTDFTALLMIFEHRLQNQCMVLRRVL